MIENNKGRSELVQLFIGVGAEIGVERGMFSRHIAKVAKKLYCVDAWKVHMGFADHVTQQIIDGLYEEAKKRLQPFNCVLIRKLSQDAVMDFKDESLDFVYIDAHHGYEHVKDDIEKWSKKVKKGGIVSGHDYIDRKAQGYTFGVVRAVNELNQEVTIWNGDRSPSWSYVKR